MKKAFALIGILFVVLIGLIYWSASSTSEKFTTCEIKNISDLRATNFREHDSVLVAISTLYKANQLKELIQGENYREAWSTPIKVPIVFLDTLKGGMEVLEEGGGKQTHSLKIKASDGTVYSLRSVNKDPQKLIPEVATRLGLENIIIDGISGQHPLGAILAAELASKAGIMHTHPKIVFVPRQKKLGKFNEKFGNRLFLLEYETKGEKNWTPFENVREIIDTDNLQELKLKKEKEVVVDKEALIKVRLFDILIGDWDRHSEQWGWIMKEENSKLTAIPLAGDRDNAFFKMGGLVPNILTNKNIKPLIRPYEKDIDYMPGLVYPFDRYFLLNTPKEVYLEQARILQDRLTNEAIEDAFRVWPKAIIELNKEEITAKLKARRDNLVQHATDFHQTIQEKGGLNEKLKGSEDLDLPEALLRCFDCDQS